MSNLLDLLSDSVGGAAMAFGSEDVQQQWESDLAVDDSWPPQRASAPAPGGGSVVEPTPSGFVREYAGAVEADAWDVIGRRGTYAWPLFEAESYRRQFRETLFGKTEFMHLYGAGDELAGPVVATVETVGRKDDPRTVLRALVRTKKRDERVLLRISDLEAAAFNPVPVLEKMLPALKGVKLRQAADSEWFDAELLRFEEQVVRPFYKFGVLFVGAAQTHENEWYNNRDISPAFDRFLNLIGERVRLRGFQHYRGGLDLVNDQTGTHSVYTTYEGNEIMFHVANLLAYHEGDEQQVERKRHLGNDVMMLIFKEPGGSPFDPREIHSQFNHVFIVITPVLDAADAAYDVEIIMKSGVYRFGPPLPAPARFKDDEIFRNWLLAKLINGERASFYAPSFVMGIRTTRKKQLQLIIDNADSRKITRKTSSISLQRKQGKSPRVDAERSPSLVGGLLRRDGSSSPSSSSASTSSSPSTAVAEPLSFMEMITMATSLAGSAITSNVLGDNR